MDRTVAAVTWVAAAALFAYPLPPNVLALPILVAGLAWLTGRSGRVALVPVDLGVLLLLGGSVIGWIVAHNADAATLRLFGTVGAVGTYALLRIQRYDVRHVAGGIAAVAAFGSLVILALLRGQLPDSAITRVAGPLLDLFAIFPGVAGDAIDVNTRFAVHQYGLAYLLLVLVSLGSGFIVLGTDRRLRAASALVVAVGALLLLATQARGALLATVVAVTVTVACRSRWALIIPPIGIAALALLLARGWLSRSIEVEWLTVRLGYWTRTLGMLGDFPFTGSGLGMRTFAEVFAWYQGSSDPYVVPHSHNIYLQAYAEAGLLGLLGLLTVTIAGLLAAVRAARCSRDWATVGLLAAFVGSLGYGLTDQVPTTNIGLALLLAITAPVAFQSPTARPAAAPLTRPLAYAAAAVALAIVAAYGLGPRWLSGGYTNQASVGLMALSLDKSLSAEARASRLPTARAAAESASRLNPHNLAAWRTLGWIALAHNDVAVAQSVAQRGAPPDATPFERAQFARLARAVGLMEQAVDLLREGRDIPRLKELADQLWSQRRWKEAAYAYSALTELEPENSENISNTAYGILYSGGSLDEAKLLLQRAVARNPGAARRLSQQLVLEGEPCRADEKRGGGNLERCLYWFTLGSWVDPTYDRPEVELGAVLYYRGRYAEAAERFSEALRRDPRNPSTMVQLADTLAKLGRPIESLELFERAVRARPERADLHATLARAYIAHDRRDDALRTIREAARLAPNNAAIRDELATIESGR